MINLKILIKSLIYKIFQLLLNGFQASRMIKNLITKENYIDCKIVRYTYYEGDEKNVRCME